MHLCFALPCGIKLSVELKEAIGPVVPNNITVEESRSRSPNLVFRVEDRCRRGQMDCTWCVVVPPTTFC